MKNLILLASLFLLFNGCRKKGVYDDCFTCTIIEKNNKRQAQMDCDGLETDWPYSFDITSTRCQDACGEDELQQIFYLENNRGVILSNDCINIFYKTETEVYCDRK